MSEQLYISITIISDFAFITDSVIFFQDWFVKLFDWLTKKQTDLKATVCLVKFYFGTIEII